MLQPLDIFTQIEINNFGIRETNFLVSQTYHRAFYTLNNYIKIPILLTPYKNEMDADFHMRKIKNDRYAAIINIHSAKHMDKIKQMMRIDGKYQLYFASVKLVDHERTKEIAAKIFRSRIINWLSRNEGIYINPKTDLTIDFMVQYGIVYLTASINNKAYKMPLDEVEDYSNLANV